MGPVAKRWNGRAYPPIGFKIDIPFVGRPTVISRKNRGRLWRTFLSRSSFFSFISFFSSPSSSSSSSSFSSTLSLHFSHSRLSFFLLPSPFSLSFSLPPSTANDSCCDRCQDASLPQAITQWSPFFLRSYHAAIAECADPREIMDCHDVLSITGLEDVRGYTRLFPCVVLRFRRATIPR